METVYIGLGSNLFCPILQIRRAVLHLSKQRSIQISRLSSLYRSQPLGCQEQPDFINAVAEIQTDLSPNQLLNALQFIERIQGRRDTIKRWGPRPLDLDILLFGKRTISTQQLQVPHLGLLQREFVLYPLIEIAPRLTLPKGECILAFKPYCPVREMIKLPYRLEEEMDGHRYLPRNL